MTPIVYYLDSTDSYIEAFKGTQQSVTFTNGNPASYIGGFTGTVSNEAAYAVRYQWSISTQPGEGNTFEFISTLNYTTNQVSAHSYIAKNGLGIQWSTNSFLHADLLGFAVQQSNGMRFFVDDRGTHIERPVYKPTSWTRLSIAAADYILTDAFNNELNMPSRVSEYTTAPNFWYEKGHKWRIFNFTSNDIKLNGTDGTPYRTMINGNVTEVAGTASEGTTVILRAKHMYELIWDGTHINIVEVG